MAAWSPANPRASRRAMHQRRAIDVGSGDVGGNPSRSQISTRSACSESPNVVRIPIPRNCTRRMRSGRGLNTAGRLVWNSGALRVLRQRFDYAFDTECMARKSIDFN